MRFYKTVIFTSVSFLMASGAAFSADKNMSQVNPSPDPQQCQQRAEKTCEFIGNRNNKACIKTMYDLCMKGE